MEPFQTRVVEEHKELLIKIEALTKFITGDKFKELPTKDAHLLIKQCSHMEAYADILQERIARFLLPFNS